MSDLQREAFEKWYKDNVPLIEHTPVTYAIAISAWQASAEANQLEIEQLREALSELLRHYVSLVESGDAGCWDSENEDVVIAARQVLAKQKG
jgi:hypothetical protein